MATFSRIDPRTIIIGGDRQRKEGVEDVTDVVESIRKQGLLNPISVREISEGLKLVAGERRLRACIELGFSEVAIHNLGEISDVDAEIIEHEENAKRRDISWRDYARSVGKMHQLMGTTRENWSVAKTAEEIGVHASTAFRALTVYENLANPLIDRADSIAQAYNMLAKFSERQASNIVGDLISAGLDMFAEGSDDIIPLPTRIESTAQDDLLLDAALGALGAEVPNTPIVVHPATLPADAPTPGTIPQEPQAPPKAQVVRVVPLLPIHNANFIEWAEIYAGPKFSVIHCDFPYGNYKGDASTMDSFDTEQFYANTEDVYWKLLGALTKNLDRLMSYSAHMIFWFNMNFYTETVQKLRTAGLMVHDHPLIWHKTGGPGGLGVTPGTATTYPRRTYDSALLAVRGNRPLAKAGLNSYAAPTVGNKIHPSQKPDPMLRFFLQMVVDETTEMLDPTAGSGAALRCAEDLGAKRIQGIELDPNYAHAANKAVAYARSLRAISSTGQ